MNESCWLPARLPKEPSKIEPAEQVCGEPPVTAEVEAVAEELAESIEDLAVKEELQPAETKAKLAGENMGMASPAAEVEATAAKVEAVAAPNPQTRRVEAAVEATSAVMAEEPVEMGAEERACSFEQGGGRGHQAFVTDERGRCPLVYMGIS